MANREFKEPRLVKDWTKEFSRLYAKSDQGRLPEEYWIATMAHSSIIGESIRRVNFSGIMKASAHAFCWICCLVNYCQINKDDLLFHLKHSLCDIVFLKFPDVCGHCMKNPCQCDPFKMEGKEDKASDYKKLLDRWKERRKSEGYKLDEWLNMFKEIYGGQNHLLTLESIGFHFLEETGEEAKAIRQLIQLRAALEKVDGLNKELLIKISSIEGLVEEYGKSDLDKEGKPIFNMKSGDLKDVKNRIIRAKMDFVSELADTFSWFCAILIKIGRIIENIKIADPNTYILDKFLQTEYDSSPEGLKCPTCEERPCDCKFFSRA